MSINRVMKSLLSIAVTLCVAVTSFAASYTLTVDGHAKQGEVPHFWSRCAGTGGAQLCVNKDWKVAAKLGVEEAGFQAYRGHRILSYSNPLIWNGSGTPSYDWTKFDEVYDFLVDTLGTVPIVELSAQPKALETSGEWSPPKDLLVYEDMIKNVVSHCIERYGMDRVKDWYWEVWNEWDYSGFWAGGNEQRYNSMYKAAVKGATAAFPEIKIGGPSTTGASRVGSFLNYCKSNNLKVDFVSNHAYGGGGAGPRANPANILGDSRSRHNAIKSFGKPLLSMNTEFNTSYSGQGRSEGANTISMDSHVNAPFVAKCVKLHLDDQLEGIADLPYVFSYWAISDVFDEHGTNGWIADNGYIPFHHVFGMINYQGVPKATFNAYRMMHKMGTERISLTGGVNIQDGVDGFATINSDTSEVTILVYNFYQNLSGQTGEDDVSLNVKNIPFNNGKVEVTHYRVDENHSNAYGVWLKQNRPSKPSDQQWEEMREASDLALLIPADTIDFSGAEYSSSFKLPRQGLSLILLKSLEAATSINGTAGQQHPMVSISGSKIFSNGKELTYSVFTIDGKRIASFTSTSSTLDFGRIARYRGVCLVRIAYEGKLITSSFIHM